MMRRIRHTLRAFLACSLAATASAWAAAPAYPVKTIRWIVPFAPGAANDTIARIIAGDMSSRLGQTVVVENKPGAGGAVGAALVASAPSDGYTLLLSNPGPNVSNPMLMKETSYKVRSFKSVIAFGYVPLIIVAHPSFPANTPQELLAYLKAHPGAVSWGSSGNLSNPHIAIELFRMATGTAFTHVPYKGSGPALNDVIAGQIQLLHSSLASVEDHIKSGRLKAIAVASRERLPQLPDVGTLSEAGIAGADSATWFGMSVPAATPQDIVDRLNTAANAVMRMPEVTHRLEKLGLTLAGGPPEVLDQLIDTDVKSLGQLIAGGVFSPQ